MNLFTSTYVIWILSEVILNRRFRSGKTDKKSVDKNSEGLIWLFIVVAMTASVFISKSYSFPIFTNEQLEFTGPVLIITGIAIRFIAIKQLGRFFTVDVTIRKDHQLMQSGFYNVIRHPSYSGSLLSFFGFGLTLNNWLGLAVVFLTVLFAFIHRMNIEEKVLMDQFGSRYAEYVKKTKRIFPFIY